MIETWFNATIVPILDDLVNAVIVFLVGQLIIRLLLALINRLLKRAHLDEIFIVFAHRVSNILFQIILFSIVLSVLGINPAFLFALLGALGLALVLAFQDSLQNFAGGILLFVLTPFHAGDELQFESYKANVREIGIYSTKLTTKDNREVIIPNASFLSNVILNNTANPVRRIDLVVRVSYEADLKRVRDILLRLMSEEPRILDEPEPKITVAELSESSVNLNVRPWVNTTDHGSVKDDLKEKIKLAFDEAGIQIPYPKLDVATNRER